MKVKEHGQKLKVQDDKYNYCPVPSESEKPKKLQRIRQKKASTFGEFSLSPQDVLDLISVKCERRTNPIWFSLVASEDQYEYEPAFILQNFSVYSVYRVNIELSNVFINNSAN